MNGSLKSLIGVVLLGVSLSIVGCAGNSGVSSHTEYRKSVATANATLRATSEKYFKTKMARDAEILAKLKDNETAAVLYGLMATDQDKSALKFLTPQKITSPTSGMDVLMKIADKTVPDITKYGFGYLFGKEVVGAMGGAQTTVQGETILYKDHSDNENAFNSGGISGDANQSPQENQDVSGSGSASGDDSNLSSDSSITDTLETE